MNVEQLRALAKAIAKKGNRTYRDGDCCPLCGYDAYWGCDSLRESEDQVFEALVNAHFGEDTEDGTDSNQDSNGRAEVHGRQDT
jgi:hypothetical protein